MKSNPHIPHPSEIAFQEYLDGELPPEDVERFNAHLDVCEECALELAFWQSTYKKIEGLPEVELRRSLASEVLPNLQTSTDTRGVLYLILAEAALGTTLGTVLWPLIRTWFDTFSLQLGNSWQNGQLQIQQFFSRFFEQLTAQLDWFGLEIESLLGETFWLATIIAALVLLFLGNGIVLKTTQTNYQSTSILFISLQVQQINYK